MVIGVSLGGALFAAWGKGAFVQGWSTALRSGAALAVVAGVLALVKPEAERVPSRSPGR
jgi:hypothetical protein